MGIGRKYHIQENHLLARWGVTPPIHVPDRPRAKSQSIKNPLSGAVDIVLILLWVRLPQKPNDSSDPQRRRDVGPFSTHSARTAVLPGRRKVGDQEGRVIRTRNSRSLFSKSRYMSIRSKDWTSSTSERRTNQTTEFEKLCIVATLGNTYSTSRAEGVRNSN